MQILFIEIQIHYCFHTRESRLFVLRKVFFYLAISLPSAIFCIIVLPHVHLHNVKSTDTKLRSKFIYSSRFLIRFRPIINIDFFYCSTKRNPVRKSFDRCLVHESTIQLASYPGECKPCHQLCPRQYGENIFKTFLIHIKLRQSRFLYGNHRDRIDSYFRIVCSLYQNLLFLIR